jgi:hypothetical protein
MCLPRVTQSWDSELDAPGTNLGVAYFSQHRSDPDSFWIEGIGHPRWTPAIARLKPDASYDFPHAAPIVSRVRMALGAGASLESVLEEIRGESNANPGTSGSVRLARPTTTS